MHPETTTDNVKWGREKTKMKFDEKIKNKK